MANCNSCGEVFDDDKYFCTKCFSGDISRVETRINYDSTVARHVTKTDKIIKKASIITIISCLIVVPFGYFVWFFIFYAILMALLFSFISLFMIMSAFNESSKSTIESFLLILWPFTPPVMLIVIFFII